MLPWASAASLPFTSSAQGRKENMASWLAHARRINRHNIASFRRAPLGEISGSLGDLGTLLPLMIALAVQNSIDLGSTLVFSGIFNILTGLVFGIPLPVQPMKVGRLSPPVCRWQSLISLRQLHRQPFRVAKTLPWASSLPPVNWSAPPSSS